MSENNTPPPEQDPPAPPADHPKPKAKEKKEEDDDKDIFKEILEEYKAKVPESVYDAVKNLSIPRQIKILKGIAQASAGEQKQPPKKKEKEVKPAEINEEVPPVHEDDGIIPLGQRFKNKEEWFSNFMNTDKLYFKGKFQKTG